MALADLSDGLALLRLRLEAERRGGLPVRDAPDVPSVADWARANCTIIHPTRGRIPFEPYPFQEAFFADRSRRRLVVKARQIGMSQAVGIEAIHGAIFHPDTLTLLVSRTADLAENLLGYCYTAIETIRDRIPALVRENRAELELANGSRIKSLPANRGTARGFAGWRAYLDEHAWQEYADEIYRGVSPILGHGGSLTVFSTPDGRANNFFRLWSGVDAGEWSRHSFDWRACPVYDQDWYNRERPNYTAAQWASEYECDFIASGQAVFRDEDIRRCADGWFGLAPPAPGRSYVTAWDIGRRADATVGVTLDVSAELWQLVAYERLLGSPYPHIQARIEQRHAAYPGEHWIESNGVGDPVMENLAVDVQPFVTTRKSKADAITALALAHEQGRLKHGVQQLAVECQLYQWDDKDLIQDSVMAAAIACFRAGQYAPPAGGWVHRDDEYRRPTRRLWGR